MKPIGLGRRLTPKQKAEIVALRAADPKTWTYVALAAKFGCTDGAAFRVVKLGTAGIRSPAAPTLKPAILEEGPKPAKPAIKPRKGQVSAAEQKRLDRNTYERARRARAAAK